MREDYSRHYQLQAAFTGSDTQTGPMVDPCHRIMDMVTAGKHGHHQDLDVSWCKSINSAFTFFDSQVNGAAFMLQRSTGKIPVSAERDRNPSVMEARAQLNSVVTHGGGLVDGIGFGKTITALLYITQMALYADHTTGHRPPALIVPNGAMFAQ